MWWCKGKEHLQRQLHQKKFFVFLFQQLPNQLDWSWLKFSYVPLFSGGHFSDASQAVKQYTFTCRSRIPLVKILHMDLQMDHQKESSITLLTHYQDQVFDELFPKIAMWLNFWPRIKWSIFVQVNRHLVKQEFLCKVKWFYKEIHV